MTTDVRTLLHDAADAPSRGPDIAGAQRVARLHRRRRRGVGALVAVVVVALVTGLVALGGGDGDDARVAIGPRQNGSEIPDGWHELAVEPGITIAVPPEWDSYDFGRTDVATTRIALATTAPPGPGVVSACVANGSVPTQAGTWLSVWEYPDPTVTEIQAPSGDVLGGFGNRRVSFVSPELGSCDHAGDNSDSNLGAAFQMFAFRDQGRLFFARAVETYPVGSKADFATADRILDTLQVEPLDGTTTVTNTLPVTTTTPETPTTTTTAVPFVPTSDDERAITNLFVAWLRNRTDDETRAIVEDADSLLDAIHQGQAQHSTADLEKYSGTVQSVRMLDADHAEVEYTLLYDGQPTFGMRTGVAVRIDGQWKVSRATVCSMLSLGGITCPAP